MARQKDFTEVEADLFSAIYSYAIANHMSIGAVELVTRSVVKELKNIAYVNDEE